MRRGCISEHGYVRLVDTGLHQEDSKDDERGS